MGVHRLRNFYVAKNNDDNINHHKCIGGDFEGITRIVCVTQGCARIKTVMSPSKQRRAATNDAAKPNTTDNFQHKLLVKYSSVFVGRADQQIAIYTYRCQCE